MAAGYTGPMGEVTIFKSESFLALEATWKEKIRQFVYVLFFPLKCIQEIARERESTIIHMHGQFTGHAVGS